MLPCVLDLCFKASTQSIGNKVTLSRGVLAKSVLSDNLLVPSFNSSYNIHLLRIMYL